MGALQERGNCDQCGCVVISRKSHTQRHAICPDCGTRCQAEWQRAQYGNRSSTPVPQYDAEAINALVDQRVADALARMGVTATPTYFPDAAKFDEAIKALEAIK